MTEPKRKNLVKMIAGGFGAAILALGAADAQGNYAEHADATQLITLGTGLVVIGASSNSGFRRKDKKEDD